ncbi:hypothetical protein FGRMN_7542 [Fusarium graminum]|nr:hypothetical protein FGRMN_7542 [Fusarium graminum]
MARMHHELTSNGVDGKPGARTTAAVALEPDRPKQEDDYHESRKPNESPISSRFRRTNEMVEVEEAGDEEEDVEPKEYEEEAKGSQIEGTREFLY